MEMFPTLVVQVILALLAAKLTFASSKSQKWWERKADLYAKLIDGIDDICRWNSHWLDRHTEDDSNLSDERKAEDKALLDRNEKAVVLLEKLANIGTFLISKEVHEDLRTFKKAKQKAWEENDHYDTYSITDDIVTAAKKCIESVREHSKDDLGLNSKFGRLMRKVRSLLSE